MIDVETSQTKRQLWIAKGCLMKSGSLHKTNASNGRLRLEPSHIETDSSSGLPVL
jgi:hypothetical protein